MSNDTATLNLIERYEAGGDVDQKARLREQLLAPKHQPLFEHYDRVAATWRDHLGRHQEKTCEEYHAARAKRVESAEWLRKHQEFRAHMASRMFATYFLNSHASCPFCNGYETAKVPLDEEPDEG